MNCTLLAISTEQWVATSQVRWSPRSHKGRLHKNSFITSHMEQSLSDSGPTWVEVGLRPDWLVGEMASEAVLHLGRRRRCCWLIEDWMVPEGKEDDKMCRGMNNYAQYIEKREAIQGERLATKGPIRWTILKRLCRAGAWVGNQSQTGESSKGSTSLIRVPQ